MPQQEMLTFNDSPSLPQTCRYDLGLAFSYTAVANLRRIEAALAQLYAATDALIAERRSDPQSDLLSALIAVESEGSRSTSQELARRSRVPAQVPEGIAAHADGRPEIIAGHHVPAERPKRSPA